MGVDIVLWTDCIPVKFIQVFTASHKIDIDLGIFRDLIDMAARNRSVSEFMSGNDIVGSHSSKSCFMLDPKALEYTLCLNHVLCKARLPA